MIDRASGPCPFSAPFLAVNLSLASFFSLFDGASNAESTSAHAYCSSAPLLFFFQTPCPSVSLHASLLPFSASALQPCFGPLAIGLWASGPSPCCIVSCLPGSCFWFSWSCLPRLPAARKGGGCLVARPSCLALLWRRHRHLLPAYDVRTFIIRKDKKRHALFSTRLALICMFHFSRTAHRAPRQSRQFNCLFRCIFDVLFVCRL